MITRYIISSVRQWKDSISSVKLSTYSDKLIEAEWRIYAPVNYAIRVQTMACRQFGANPLSEPMLVYC